MQPIRLINRRFILALLLGLVAFIASNQFALGTRTAVASADIPVRAEADEAEPLVPVAIDGPIDQASMEKAIGKIGDPKLDTKLNLLVASSQTNGRRAAFEQVDTAGLLITNNKVLVEVRTNPDTADSVEAYFAANRIEVRNKMEVGYYEVWVTPTQLTPMVAQPDIYFAGPARLVGPIGAETAVSTTAAATNVATGATTSEGVAESGADAWHDKGIDGTGVPFFNIDVGFLFYEDRQATNDWPSNDQLTIHALNGFPLTLYSNHATNTVAVNYDYAPGAEYRVLSAASIGDIHTFVNLKDGNGDPLVANGILSSSIYDGPFSVGDGTIRPNTMESYLQTAYNNDVLVVQAAGNGREAGWNGLYNGDSDSGNLHLWDGNTSLNTVGQNESIYCLLTGGVLNLHLAWDDWTDVTQDFDLFLLTFNGASWEVSATSTNTQNGGSGQTPTESISYTIGNDAAVCGGGQVVAVTVIDKTGNGAGHYLRFKGDDSIPWNQSVTSSTFSAVNASPHVFTVAAIDIDSKAQESYSAEGPVLAPGGGTPSGVGHIPKPDVASYANISIVPGATFNGTSAAAPHVAGMAALLRQCYPDLTVDELMAEMRTLAQNRDLGATGFDNVYGYGEMSLGTILEDLGDLAASYGEAIHNQCGPTARLGTTIDQETSSDVGDDDNTDDGITLVSPLVPGETAYLQVEVSGTAVSPWFAAWVDWDGDGTFSDATETIIDQAVSIGTQEIAFTVPAGHANVTRLPALRARVYTSAQTSTQPTGTVNAGEVEDYVRFDCRADFGDLAASYGTAVHGQCLSNLRLGTLLSYETSSSEGHDDSTDEGVKLTSLLLPGETASIQVDVSTFTLDLAWLAVWMDWDGDGTFSDATEQIIDEAVADGLHDYTFAVPADHDGLMAVPLRARVYASEPANALPTGVAIQGEVEDYLVFDCGLDLGDLAVSYGEATHGNCVTTVQLGATIDSETSSSEGADDTSDDGVVLTSLLLPGETASIQVGVIGTAVSPWLAVWADWNGDGSFSDSSETLVDEEVSIGTHDFSFSVPNDHDTITAVPLRVRVYESEPDDVEPTGVVNGGEVEDYLAFDCANVTATIDVDIEGTTVILDEWIACFNLIPSGIHTFNFTEDITLTAAIPELSNDKSAVLTINGNGYTIDGGNAHRPFKVTDGTVVINNVTLKNGRSPDNECHIYTCGGAVFVGENAVVTINNSTLHDNEATAGGAILADGLFTLNNSTVYNNDARWGGAIYVWDESATTINNSTLSGNTSTEEGGAIFAGGMVSLTNATVAENVSDLKGDALYIQRTTATIVNSIISNSNGKRDCEDFVGTWTTSNSLSRDNSCRATQSSSINLGTLQDNGSSTMTHALLDGSSAIDAGNNGVCLASPINNVDQRGIARPQGTTCDAGAYERRTAVSPVLSINSDPALEWTPAQPSCTTTLWYATSPHGTYSEYNGDPASFDVGTPLGSSSTNYYWYLDVDCIDDVESSNTLGEFTFDIVPGN
ncbi:MAG: GEVED domain-containing protein [Chloroflexota bacterium]